jgi:hypothetical protein
MHASRSQKPFACVECHTRMERVQSVPVLQSLADHTVYSCDGCGHNQLVREERAGEWSAQWLNSISLECGGAISCAALV